MQDMEIVTDPKTAALLLDPVRRQLLAAAGEPVSATQLAQRVGLSRQKVNYHVRALEERGLLRQVEERRWGGITERLLVATAISYVVSPEALGDVWADPRKVTDRLSAQYLVALAARAVREVGELVRRAGTGGEQVATLSLDSVVRFRSAAERAEFANDLGAAVRALLARYHAGDEVNGREHRLVIAVHPVPADSPSETDDATQGKEQS